ncbi:MAG: cytochrome c [Gammaproteobacteria bacterium]|nr:cytochrome c [Gammaproteobacteria bacterium]
MKIIYIALAILGLSMANIAQAGDAAAGKAKSSVCIACHGANGIGTTNLNPNLAGQKEAYLVKSIKAYRDGARKDPMMGAMAKPLSDTDIDNLAAYFSSL